MRPDLLNFRPAFISLFVREGNDPEDYSRLTYRKLLEETCRFANVLKSKGVSKGDRVVIYMPMILELPIAMLACTRIGAVHSVVVITDEMPMARYRVRPKYRVVIVKDGTISLQGTRPTLWRNAYSTRGPRFSSPRMVCGGARNCSC